MRSPRDSVVNHGWLMWLLLLPALAAAAVLGFFVFLVALGLVLLAALAFGLRLWWLRRKIARAERHQRRVLEGEFVVVRETARADERRPS